jgi:hypothetical protein
VTDFMDYEVITEIEVSISLVMRVTQFIATGSVDVNF